MMRGCSYQLGTLSGLGAVRPGPRGRDLQPGGPVPSKLTGKRHNRQVQEGSRLAGEQVSLVKGQDLSEVPQRQDLKAGP